MQLLMSKSEHACLPAMNAPLAVAAASAELRDLSTQIGVRAGNARSNWGALRRSKAAEIFSLARGPFGDQISHLCR